MNNKKLTKEIIKDNIDYSKICSPSRLKMFEQCPKQYYFTYLDPNDNYDISGKFYLIIKAGDRLHIIDFKTSKKEESDFFQLRFYKVLAEEKFKIPVEKVSFYYLRTGIKTDFGLKDMS